nr:MAG TPA: hypothetical protein [Bacteriophage sp.]
MIFQSTVYPNVIPVNGILQQYLVSGGAISAGDFVQFADAVATGTKTLIGIAPSTDVPPILLNETDVLVFGGDGNRTARVVRFTADGISVGEAADLIADGVSNATVTVHSAEKLTPSQIVIGISRIQTKSTASISYGVYAEIALVTIAGLAITPGQRVQLERFPYSSTTPERNGVNNVEIIALTTLTGMVCYSMFHVGEFNDGTTRTELNVNGFSTDGGYLHAGTAYQFAKASGLSSGEVYGAKVDESTALLATNKTPKALGLVAIADASSAAVSPVGAALTYAFTTVTKIIVLSDSKFVLIGSGTNVYGNGAACGYVNGGNNIQLGTMTFLGVKSPSYKRFNVLTRDTIVTVAGGIARVFRANDDLTITLGEAVTLSTSAAAISPLKMTENAVFFYGGAQATARVSNLTLSPETITTPASADMLTAALYSESAGTLRVFGGTTAAKGFANSLAASVQPYSNAAYGVASTGGAAGETIDVFLPKT